jgi:hypothetical protein
MRRNFRKAKDKCRNCEYCKHYEGVNRYGKMVQLCLDPTVIHQQEWRLATKDYICDNFSSTIVLRGTRLVRAL